MKKSTAIVLMTVFASLTVLICCVGIYLYSQFPKTNQAADVVAASPTAEIIPVKSTDTEVIESMSTTEPTATEKPTEEPTETTEPTAEPTKSDIGAVGDTIQQGDYIITLVSVDKQKSFGTLATAGEGKILIAVELIIESAADKGVSANLFYCTLQDSDGFSYNFSVFGKDPALAAINDIPYGEKTRGWATFEVPETASGFVFRYEPISITESIRIRFSLGL